MQDATRSEPGQGHLQRISNAYILENSVFHARHLHTTSKHAFTYPTLAFLLRLSSLESHSLDLCSGRLFGYSDAGDVFSWARVTGIRPEAYLHDPYSHSAAESTSKESLRGMRRKSIREKLDEVLGRFGLDPGEMEDAWMLTMPRYLGVEGINPLTVYYCYKKDHQGEREEELALWVVVLEVHNTFGERHVYVLRTGPEHEDQKVVPGYAHSWTFPRQFHVSPFNDRSGFYTCSLVPPPSPPLPTSSSKGISPPQPPATRSLPKILIQLWTPERKLKLTASLRSKSSAPLTSRNLLTALTKYPFTLLLSFARIAWQAFHLHYGLGLDVYARPEPRAVDPAVEDLFSGEAGNEDSWKVIRRNDVQRKDGELGIGGGLGWQPEGLLERFSRRRVERLLKIRARETGIKVHLASTNPAHEPRTYSPALSNTNDNASNSDTAIATSPKERELTLITRSPRAFLLVFISSFRVHALLLARDAERLLSVSDEKLFLEVFSTSSSGEHPLNGGVNINPTVFQRVAQKLRQLPIPYTLLHEPKLSIPPVHPLDTDISYCHSHHSPHLSSFFRPLRNAISSLQTLLVISAFIALTYLEKLLFLVLGARFVRGTEPWGLWERAEGVWLARNRDQQKQKRKQEH